MSRLMTLLRGSLPRAFIACATVIVATLAALAAYNTALKEQDAAVTERLLVQAQLLEIADLTHSVNTANLRLELGSRIQGDFERGTKAHDTRDWLRSQEEFAAAGVLLAVPGAPEQWAEIDAIPSSFEPEFSRALTALGFTPAIVSPEEARRGRTALGPLVQEVRTIDRQVVELSIGALFLVLTLFLLICADLWRPAGRQLLAASTMVCITAVVLILAVDRAVATQLACVALVLVGLVYALWRMRALGDTRTTEHHVHPEPVELVRTSLPSLHNEPQVDRFSRIAIIAAGITVVFSAVAISAYNFVEGEIADAAIAADDHATKMIQELSIFELGDAQLWRHVADALELRVRLTFTRQTGSRAGGSDQEAQFAALTPVTALIDDPTYGIDAGWGPTPGLHPPHDTESEHLGRAVRAFREQGLWDSSNEEMTARRGAAAKLLATLTLFAIALFLFAQAHVFGQGRPGVLLLASGAGLVLIAAGLGAWALRSGATTGAASADRDVSRSCARDTGLGSAELAAQYYASGMVALQDGESEPAIRDLRCAVQIRPASELAARSLVRALLAGRSSDARSSKLTRLAQALALEEGTIAQHRGHESAVTFRSRIDASMQAISLGMQERSIDRLKEAEAMLADASAPKGAEEVAVLQRNAVSTTRAIIELARGEVGSADVGLSAAFSNYSPDLEYNAPTLLSLLKSVADNCFLSSAVCAAVTASAQQGRQRLMALVLDHSRSPSAGTHNAREPAAHVQTVEAGAGTDFLWWRGLTDELPHHLGEIVVAWYYSEPETHAWSTLQIGSVDPATQTGGNMLALRTVQQGCVAPGRYGFEVYVDGKLSDQGEVVRAGAALKRQRVPELNLQACVAADMKSLTVPLSARADGALLRAYGRIDGMPELVLATWYSAYDATVPLGIGSVTSGPVVPRESNAYLRTRGLVDSVAGGRRLGAALLEEDQPRCQEADPPVDIVFVSWKTEEGFVHVAGALPGSRPWPELCQMLVSVRTLRDPFVER